ncbi:MAG: hypothetical protein J5545_03485 [Bacteroidaceae bacterium]|nr:hypothetical protein [Bacteroidaceae bacterium]
MNNTEDIKFQEMDELIERFLRGEMTPEEEELFHEELKSNSDLREQARAVSALLKGLKEKESTHDQVIINEVTATKRPSSVRRLALWAASIAAVLAIYFGYSYHAENVRYARINEMLTPYYEHYDVDELSRGDTDSVIIAELYSLFNRIHEEKDMKDIIAELESIHQSLTDEFTYYQYDNDIVWNLALAYIKDDQTDKAIPLLESLYQDNLGSPIAAKAQELLKKLHSK